MKMRHRKIFDGLYQSSLPIKITRDRNTTEKGVDNQFTDSENCVAYTPKARYCFGL